jgi:hypothetical protein
MKRRYHAVPPVMTQSRRKGAIRARARMIKMVLRCISTATSHVDGHFILVIQ